MKRSLRVITMVVLGAIAALGTVVAVEFFAQNHFKQTLFNLGYRDARIEKIRLYFDGLVADHVDLGNGVVLNKLYLQGNPVALYQHEPERIWIDRAEINLAGWGYGRIVWPIPPKVLFDVDLLNITATIWQKNITMRGSLKQDNPARAVFTLMANNADMMGVLQGELLTEQGEIKTFNLEFDGEHVALQPLDARRVIAWFSLHHDKDWSIAGEVNAGSLNALPLNFLDVSLKLQGNAAQPIFSFSAVSQLTQNNWDIDTTTSNQVMVQTADEQKTYDISLLDQQALINWLHSQKEMLPEPQPEKSILAKPKPIAKHAAPIITPPQTAPVPTPVVAPLQPIAIPQVSLTDLAENSLFTGFNYSNTLSKVDMPCDTAEQGGCWKAYALGGTLRYDIVPPYMQRLKNYEQATLLRQVMQNLAVDMIRINGKDNTIGNIVIKGKAADGRPVYLELSVGDIL